MNKSLKELLNMKPTTFATILLGLIGMITGLVANDNSFKVVGAIIFIFALITVSGKWVISTALSLIIVFMIAGTTIDVSGVLWPQTEVSTMSSVFVVFVLSILVSYTSNSYELYNRWVLSVLITIFTFMTFIFVALGQNFSYNITLMITMIVAFSLILATYILVVDVSKRSKILDLKYEIIEHDLFKIIKFEEKTSLYIAETNKSSKINRIKSQYGFVLGHKVVEAYPWLINEAVNALDNDKNLIVIMQGKGTGPIITVSKKNSNRQLPIMFNYDEKKLQSDIEYYENYLNKEQS